MKIKLSVLLLCCALLLTGCNTPKTPEISTSPNKPTGTESATQGTVSDLGDNTTGFGEDIKDTGAYDGYFDGESADIVMDYHEEKVKKAYPAYFDTYDEIDTLVDYLKSIDNLYCVGRNGQHRYNNLDHSMCTSFEAVKNIISGEKNKEN